MYNNTYKPIYEFVCVINPLISNLGYFNILLLNLELFKTVQLRVAVFIVWLIINMVQHAQRGLSAVCG